MKGKGRDSILRRERNKESTTSNSNKSKIKSVSSWVASTRTKEVNDNNKAQSVQVNDSKTLKTVDDMEREKRREQEMRRDRERNKEENRKVVTGRYR